MSIEATDGSDAAGTLRDVMRADASAQAGAISQDAVDLGSDRTEASAAPSDASDEQSRLAVALADELESRLKHLAEKLNVPSKSPNANTDDPADAAGARTQRGESVRTTRTVSVTTGPHSPATPTGAPAATTSVAATTTAVTTATTATSGVGGAPVAPHGERASQRTNAPERRQHLPDRIWPEETDLPKEPAQRSNPKRDLAAARVTEANDREAARRTALLAAGLGTPA